jgi:long-chain acyl-CoA synthetase
VRSAAAGLRDGLVQLVGLARIERTQPRQDRACVVETPHGDVSVPEVLERLRVVRPQSQRLAIRLHRLVEATLLAKREAEPIPRLGQRGIERDGLAVLLLGGRPVAPFGQRASFVESHGRARAGALGLSQRRIVDARGRRRHREPDESQHQPTHRRDGSIWRVNLARLGEESVERFGEYAALQFEGRELTNVDQQRTGARVANALARMGVRPGDRVVVLMPNCPEVLAAYTGILKAGAVIVPIVFLLSADEVRHILGDSGAKVVITAPELASKVDGWPGPVITVGADAGARTWDDWIAHESDAFATIDRADGDLVVILYTSGTTGKPKGVALSHANLASNARAAASIYELDRTRWNLGVLPLSHSYGLVTMNAGNVLGTRTVLLRWFNPEAVLDAIARFRVQSMAGVPTMYVYLLNHAGADRFDTSSMRSWGSGAAPLPVEIIEPFEKKFGGRLVEGYGLTEASPVVTSTRLSSPRKPGSVGQPLPGVQVVILDEHDRALPIGETGEIGVRGPNVMLGYYGLPDETERTLRNGWLHTGDVGRLDADGFLYIVERKKDLIIRGGFNVYPREVEEVLYAHPAVAEAAVVGMRDALMGEEVCAFVTLRPGASADADAIIGFCQSRLAKYKCPREVRFLPALPKNPVGKILRKELRALV